MLSKTTPGQCSLYTLPYDVCCLLLKYTSLPDSLKLSQTCHFWHNVVTRNRPALFKHHCHLRFKLPHEDAAIHQRRLDNDPLETLWEDFYKRLDSGVTGWHGMALDPATNDFTPYPMELVFTECTIKHIQGIQANIIGIEAADVSGLSDVCLSEMHGFCRWRTLNDGLTRVEATIVDNSLTDNSRFQMDPLSNHHVLRNVVIEEVSVMRGTDLAVPNRYYAVTNGFVVIGAFNPGDANMLGVFCVVMEDICPYNFQLSSIISLNNVLQGHLTTAAPLGPRKTYNCRFTITQIEGTQISGTFSINTITSLTSCNIQTQSKHSPQSNWIQFDVTATTRFERDGLSDKVVLFDDFLLTLAETWLDDDSASWVASTVALTSCKVMLEGNILIGFWSNPLPGVFYLSK